MEKNKEICEQPGTDSSRSTCSQASGGSGCARWHRSRVRGCCGCRRGSAKRKCVKYRLCHHPLNTFGIESNLGPKSPPISCTKYLYFYGDLLKYSDNKLARYHSDFNSPEFRSPIAVTMGFY